MHRSTILCALSAIVSLAYAGDFSKSCSSISFRSTSISASCNDKFGDSVGTNIDLTRCLANVGGRLVFCDCGLAGDRSVLNCRCTDSTGTKKPTSIDLDSCLTNDGGDLEC
ncbi:Cvnh domain-containing protein [Colletotrichum higginsianum IMI 349063]|uniref:Cvnh domain-containing protein n=1 Tax=Colletotrichum higginsianum (strain IMI 349063) TaxID=759273 RepID=A0A1B7YBQ2_COLHI|nr:Cvnh domain-containing protein [Colletotrichum higginsianum IMI 349063]OBR09516.1 Cvnh domain-containing protein [Colletotrichum higginsianum IMI 349063]